MTSVEELIGISKQYRDEVPALLTETSPEVVEQKSIIRDEFKVQLREAGNVLQNRIDELEKMKRDLANERSWQTSDIKKLEALKWELIRSRPK
jgi:hypothetical protein